MSRVFPEPCCRNFQSGRHIHTPVVHPKLGHPQMCTTPWGLKNSGRSPIKSLFPLPPCNMCYQGPPFPPWYKRVRILSLPNFWDSPQPIFNPIRFQCSQSHRLKVSPMFLPPLTYLSPPLKVYPLVKSFVAMGTVVPIRYILKYRYTLSSSKIVFLSISYQYICKPWVKSTSLESPIIFCFPLSLISCPLLFILNFAVSGCFVVCCI